MKMRILCEWNPGNTHHPLLLVDFFRAHLSRGGHLHAHRYFALQLFLQFLEVGVGLAPELHLHFQLALTVLGLVAEQSQLPLQVHALLLQWGLLTWKPLNSLIGMPANRVARLINDIGIHGKKSKQSFLNDWQKNWHWGGNNTHVSFCSAESLARRSWCNSSSILWILRINSSAWWVEHKDLKELMQSQKGCLWQGEITYHATSWIPTSWMVD